MNEVVPLLSTTNQALAYENRAWTLLRDPAFLHLGVSYMQRLSPNPHPVHAVDTSC